MLLPRMTHHLELFFVAPLYLAVQRIVKVGGGKFKCSSCGRQFRHRSNANKHYRTQHLPVEKATCQVCQKTFKNALQRNAHRVKEHGISAKMMKTDPAAVAPQLICLPKFEDL